MLSIHPVGDGAYYMHLTEREHDPGRYYLQEDNARVIWSGQGAHAIGLCAQVNAESFQRALLGLHPDTGAPLVRNAGRSDRRQAYDLTFSAPKAVSALWSVSGEAARREIEQAFDRAVQAAIGHLEETCGRTRRGKGGREIERAGLVCALFPHAASRADEPQLHTHCVLINLGVRPDSTVGTLYTPPVYSMKMTLGALFRAELAAQLQSRLGLAIRPERIGFGIEGVPSALCDAFSTRRKEIERALKSAGSSARASEVAALATRRSKDAKPPETLFPVWQAVGEAYGFGPSQAQRLLTRRRLWRHTDQARLRRTGANRLFQDALSQLTRSQSFFTERELTRALAEQAPGRGAGSQQVIDTVRRHLSDNPNLVALGAVRGEMRYTTRAVLQEERRMLDRVERMRRERGRTVSERTLSRVLSDCPHLSDEQRQALRHLTAAPGRIQILTGLAGTGKTDVLQACRNAWEKEGLAVYGVAVSGKAARGLQEATGIQSATAASFLRSLEPGELSRKTFHGRRFSSLNAMLKYAEKARRPWLRLNHRTVVVMEEAGMSDTRTLARIVEHVYRAGAKLALVGDERQLQPIGAGGPLNSLQRRYGSARLQNIQRQREPWAREVVSAMSQGRSADALRALWERGRIHIAADRKEAMEALLADWGRRPSQELPQTLILTGRRQEADYLNRQSQAVRRKRGELGSVGLTVGDHTFYAGDRVLITRNSRLYDVQNGALGTVLEVSPRHPLRIRPLQSAIRVLLDDGRRVTINTADFPHMTLGYAITTHKGQGATVENACILVGGGMQDLHLSYVQISRARGETRLYVDRSEAGEGLKDLMRAMRRDRRKELAADVQDGLLDDPRHARAQPQTPRTTAREERSRFPRQERRRGR